MLVYMYIMFAAVPGAGPPPQPPQQSYGAPPYGAPPTTGYPPPGNKLSLFLFTYRIA